MPSSSEIVGGLTAIANRFWYLALAWHVALGLALVALVAGWRPTRRAAGALMVLPLYSVALLAYSQDNPFNGSVFFLAAVALMATAARLPPDRVTLSRHWAETSAGVVLLAFGWSYPHFLTGAPLVAYLYAAPTGLVPCPTLSALIGLSLLARGLESRSWSWLLASLGCLYGIFGALRLGVRMDLMLCFGALALAVVGMTAPWRAERAPHRRPTHHIQAAD
jgi:hypothetical protein